MSKGYFTEVLSIVQSVLILAKIFGCSNLTWSQTFIPTALYIMLWFLACIIVATNKKILEDERSIKSNKEYRRNIDMTTVNKFTDDGK